jgi:hypothetical protein
VNQDEKDKADPEKTDLPWTSQACYDQMVLTNKYIKDVSAPIPGKICRVIDFY